MPSRVTVSDIKSKFLRPSLTSYFEVEVPMPGGANLGDKDQGRSTPDWCTKWTTQMGDRINLLCSEAVLPGSNLATFETNNDRTGVTERFAHRRIFDDRIDLTFNVDGGMYSPIRFFEEWIDYITGGASSPKRTDFVSDDRNDLDTGNYYYRMRYPIKYLSTGLSVRKFERDMEHYNINDVPSQSDPSRGIEPKFKYKGIQNKVKRQDGKNNLTYKFINAYPMAISSMPVSYDSSSVLKCTVSFTYIRYVIENLDKDLTPLSNS